MADGALLDAPAALRDYAFLGDGHRGALVGPEGDVAWMCFPRWEDPAVFGTLIGSGGRYSLQPSGRCVWGGYYEDRSLVWRSRWVTDTATVESHDALAYPGAEHLAVLLRRVHSTDGPSRIEVQLDPACDYGRRPVGRWHFDDGVWWGKQDGVFVRWHGAEHARVTRRGSSRRHLALTFDLAAGEYHDLVLEVSDRPLDEADRPDPSRLWDQTRATWRATVPALESTVAARSVRRSYAVLAGLTPPGGGTVAAATTSLPERARAGRNYDYRYTWIRDLCYIGLADASLGAPGGLLDGAVGWVRDRLLADGAGVSPAYTSGGLQIPPETRLDLPGYPGGQDVVGNRVRDQFQLDILGEALLLFAAAARADRLDADGWRAAAVAAEAIASRWNEPDAGVWELSDAWWAHSRLVCVGGLQAIAQAGEPGSSAAGHLALADHMLAEVSRTCTHPSGRWQRTPDDHRVDACLLLAEVRGALPQADPRHTLTRRSVANELSRHGFVYRFRHHDSQLADAEGAFLIGNFWMSLACLRAGEEIEAVRWFERARSAAGTTGLFSEEYDVEQHQLRGNLPQAFVHGLMIEAAGAQRHDADGLALNETTPDARADPDAVAGTGAHS